MLCSVLLEGLRALEQWPLLELRHSSLEQRPSAKAPNNAKLWRNAVFDAAAGLDTEAAPKTT